MSLIPVFNKDSDTATGSDGTYTIYVARASTYPCYNISTSGYINGGGFGSMFDDNVTTGVDFESASVTFPYRIIITLPVNKTYTGQLSMNLVSPWATCMPKTATLNTYNGSYSASTFTPQNVNYLQTVDLGQIGDANNGPTSHSWNLSLTASFNIIVIEILSGWGSSGHNNSIWITSIKFGGPVIVTAEEYASTFTSHAFTNAGATGRTGPTLSEVRTAYSTAMWAQDTRNTWLNMTGNNGIQLWTVPKTGIYTIRAAGAAGASHILNSSSTSGVGLGYQFTTVVNLMKGGVYAIVVGQRATPTTTGDESNGGGAGGGGSFIWNNSGKVLLAAAGGGGGRAIENVSGSNTLSETYGINGLSGTAASLFNYASSKTTYDSYYKANNGQSGGNWVNASSSGYNNTGGKGWTEMIDATDFTGRAANGYNSSPGFGGGSTTPNHNGGGGGGYSGGGSLNYNVFVDLLQSGGGGGSSYSASAMTNTGTNTNENGSVTVTYVSQLTLPGLYAFTGHTFTNAGTFGRVGPSLSSLRAASGYSSAAWAQDTVSNYLNMTNDDGIQLWKVPATGAYTIQAAGAMSGTGGSGANISIVTILTEGEIIKILVGQIGGGGSGGGGTFVVRGTNTALLVAGGGGGKGNTSASIKQNAVTTTTAQEGAGDSNYGNSGSDGQGGDSGYYSGTGGGGLYGYGGNYFYYAVGGGPFTDGGGGGTGEYDGGFGGGGASSNNMPGGGGGGYSGGGGGGTSGYGNSTKHGGGGGGSYIISGTRFATFNASNESASGGYVVITPTFIIIKVKTTTTITTTKSTIVLKYISSASLPFNFFTTNNTDSSYTRTYSSNATGIVTIPNSSTASATVAGVGTTTINVAQSETANFTSFSAAIVTIVIIGPGVTYSSLDMTSADLSGSNIANATFNNCDLTSADLFGAIVNSSTSFSTSTKLKSLKSGRINGFTTLLPAGYKMI